jgi:4-hydroxybenzoate polyprenyltransferase
MSTLPILFDISRTTYWILGFTVIHAMMAFLFMTRLGWIGRAGLLVGLIILMAANGVILQNRTPESALKVLPLFHVTMLLYALSISLDSVV